VKEKTIEREKGLEINRPNDVRREEWLKK